MDWELSIKHLASGSIPLFGVLALYYAFIGKRRRPQPGHIITSFVFCFYFMGILTMTGIWYLGEFAPRIVYMPFADMIRGPVGTVLNVLLFVPFGVLLPILYENYDSIGKVALAGFLLSLSVEIVQMFGCGTTDINDLITNTAGACLGYCISKPLCRSIPKPWKKAVRADGVHGRREWLLFWGITLVLMITIQPRLYRVWFASV